MVQDKIMQEVRRVRESIAERNDFDVRKIVEDVKRREADRKKLQQRERKSSVRKKDEPPGSATTFV
jgi:hypothetical protein